MTEKNRPFAIIVQKGVFDEIKSEQKKDKQWEMGREEALKTIMDILDGNEIIVSTTGKISRELFEYRIQNNLGCDYDFYNVGAMGCAQSIALSISLQKKNKKIFVFDGDGAVLMQMGALATIGHYAPKNFYHIIFDNQAHDSTGGQPTCADTVNFVEIARACNYRSGNIVQTKEELREAMKDLKKKTGPVMIVIKVKKGSRDDLRRPNKKPVEYKVDFMKTLMESK